MASKDANIEVAIASVAYGRPIADTRGVIAGALIVQTCSGKIRHIGRYFFISSFDNKI